MTWDDYHSWAPFSIPFLNAAHGKLEHFVLLKTNVFPVGAMIPHVSLGYHTKSEAMQHLGKSVSFREDTLPTSVSCAEQERRGNCLKVTILSTEWLREPNREKSDPQPQASRIAFLESKSLSRLWNKLRQDITASVLHLQAFQHSLVTWTNITFRKRRRALK